VPIGIRRSHVRAIFRGPITHEAVVEASGSAAVELDVLGVVYVGITAEGSAYVGLDAQSNDIISSGSASVELSAEGEGGIVGLIANGEASIGVTGSGTALTGVGCSGSASVSISIGDEAFAAVPIYASGSAEVALSAEGHCQVAEVYSAIALNLKNRGHAEYLNYPFNSLFYLDGQYYGISSLGIEKLSGATDNGTAVAASVVTGLETFGANFNKAVDELELQLRTAGAMEVVVTHGENEKRPGYTVAADNVPGLHGRRRKLAKGARATAWRFEAKNVAGADFDLTEFTAIVDPLERKVG
jgi:hypothetical protein